MCHDSRSACEIKLPTVSSSSYSLLAVFMKKTSGCLFACVMFDRLLIHAWGELIEYFCKLFRLLIPCDADYISLHLVNQSEFIARSVFVQ